MASFRIHEDQENSSLGLRKENVDVFSAIPQRRALGDLSHFACNQTRNIKLSALTNIPTKIQDENRTVRQINNEKNIVPPVAQFRAFSVYEDKPTQADLKKREPTFKPFVAKDIKKENFLNVESIKNVCTQIEKQPEKLKEAVAIRAAFQEKRDEPVESPMSVAHDASMLSNMSIVGTDTTVQEDDDEEIVTAQTDREMFFHVVQYRQDIYEYMREIEVKHRANPRYMKKQPDINHNMRSILVDWLAEVCEEYSQQTETLHLAVSYVDRFLSYMSVVRAKLQLVGTAATFIAAKFEEVYPPEVSDFVYITDDTYTKREVLRMEHLILKVLSFDLSTPTSLSFLSHYCISNDISKKTFHLAAYIAELSLLEADPYLQYKPSMIAASALATALHCLFCQRCDKEPKSDAAAAEVLEEAKGAEAEGAEAEAHPECWRAAWPAAAARGAGLGARALAGCVRALARTHAHAARQPHQAIVDKYRTKKFDYVSSIEPRPMFPVPKYQAPPNANKTETRAPESRPAGETVRVS